MFCPQCGSNQGDELKFCKLCGANLQGVREALTAPATGEKADWMRMNPAERVISWAEAQRRKDEIDRRRGLTPEIKRYNEIKAGVITSSVGVADSFFLFVFMEGIYIGGNVPPGEAEILSRVWVAGIIPFFVGLALIINGLFVSKKIVEAARREREARPDALPGEAAPAALRAADTTEFIPTPFSVTEDSTKHLGTPARKQ